MTTAEPFPRRSGRKSRLSPARIAQRRADVEAAQAMNQLEGAPVLSAADQALLGRWIEGKISTREYIARCRPC